METTDARCPACGRTPFSLNAIIGFSEVLQERLFGELNDKQAEYIQDILTTDRR
jgi:hypothetical protein